MNWSVFLSNAFDPSVYHGTWLVVRWDLLAKLRKRQNSAVKMKQMLLLLFMARGAVAGWNGGKLRPVIDGISDESRADATFRLRVEIRAVPEFFARFEV